MRALGIILLALGTVSAGAGGIAVGRAVASQFKPDTVEYLVDEVKIDLESAKANYRKIESSDGDFSKMEPDQAVQMAYLLFAEEEQNYSIGVGYTLASIVKQDILARSAKDGGRYFEESLSIGLVNIHDRMYQEGENVDTYWGESEDFASHPKKSYPASEYVQMMGRQVKESLIYVVAPESMSDTSLSGDPLSGISKTENGYKIEIELDPVKGVSNYQKQMQTISDLASKPAFDFCHLTFYTDSKLNLIRFETHEKYIAMTKSGVGSKAEGRLVTMYYHSSLPEGGFPEVDSPSYDYPSSL